MLGWILLTLVLMLMIVALGSTCISLTKDVENLKQKNREQRRRLRRYESELEE